MSQRSPLRLDSALILATLGLPAAAQVHVPWEGFDTSRYPQGHTSWSMVAADFDADGAQDLAVCSWYANSRLTVLFGDGAGRFAPPVFYTLPLGAIDLGAADFDGDGDVDLAVSNTGQVWEGSSVSLFLNQGNGAFIDAGPWAAGPGPSGMTVADFDGDGQTDVAVAHDAYINCASSIAVLLNGSGGFLSPNVIPLSACTYDLEAGDLDGDGDQDLVVVHETGVVTLVKNLGGASFDSGTTYTIDLGYFPPYAIALGDSDRDGDLDVFATGQTYQGGPSGPGFGCVARLENLGGGKLGAPVAIPLHPGCDGGAAIEVADVTGDAWPDLLVATGHSQSWSLVANDGSGGFGLGRELRSGEDPRKVLARDLDGDGDRDVVVLGGDSLEACVYLNPGAGAFEQPPVIDFVPESFAPCSYSNLATGDIDHDGDLDLVAGYSSNFSGVYGVRVRRNQGDGTFAAAENYSHAIFPSAVRLRDLDGDGSLDLLFAEDSSSFRVAYRRNQGNGAFGPVVMGPQVGCQPDSLEAFDVDADGDLDVVASCFQSLKICKRNSNGTYAAATSSPLTSEASAIAAGDFNGDGRLDFATNTAIQGYVEISLANTSGGYQTPFMAQSGRDVRAIAVAKIDGDAFLDLAVAYNLDGTGLSILRGRGDGTFKPPLSYMGSYSATNDQVRSIALGDLDRDGVLDATVANFGSQDVSFWRGHGDGTFDEVRRLGVGQQAWDVHVGEFNGDTLPDVAVLVQRFSPDWYQPGVVLLPGELGGVANYCTAGTTSNGCSAHISAVGVPSASATSGFTLSVSNVDGLRQGLIFYGVSGGTALAWGPSSSFLCVKPPTQRTPAQNSGGTLGQCNGAFVLDWNAYRATHPGALGSPFAAGDTVQAQAWFRDPPSPKTTHLSDALQFSVHP